MKKLIYLLVAGAMAGGIVGCGPGSGGDEKGDAEPKSFAGVTEDSTAKLAPPPVTTNLAIGFCKTGDKDYDASHFNLNAELVEGKNSTENAKLVVSVIDLDGKVLDSKTLLNTTKGVEVWLNAAQTLMNYNKIELGPAGNATSLAVNTANFGPDIKISDENAVFNADDPSCSIVGADDARDFTSRKVECLPSILADLNGQKVYRIHFSPTGQSSGDIIFSYETNGDLRPSSSRCSQTTLNVQCWASDFSALATPCDPPCQ